MTYLTYHNIEVIVTEDEKKLKLKGEIYGDIHEYGNPKVTIFDKEGDIGATQTPPYSMKLSEFMYELEIIQSSAYSFKELRPMNFSMNIKIGEAKE